MKLQLYASYTACKGIYQGMTIRTAQLPGADNLLGQAGEDLGGLPDRESHYQFLFFIFLSTVS